MREDFVEAGEVGPGFWYKGGEACDKVQGLEDHMGSAITPGGLEGVADLAGYRPLKKKKDNA
ncbi:hypothetical protein DFR30_1986 [Thiogranum longum]|uniref:Uncharacterized protein n=1 Tax=Thiogranum longum TaxID=1537524 RepID=A0A4R1HN70_9GAMM|nr:hypothetical protein DFR30_1986 [Thiogranum longum]